VADRPLPVGMTQLRALRIRNTLRKGMTVFSIRKMCRLLLEEGNTLNYWKKEIHLRKYT